MGLSLFIAAALIAADPAPPIVALTLAPDAAQVLAGSQAGVQILSLPDLKPAGRLDTRLEHIHELAFAPDGKLLAIAGGSPGERGAVELWDWPAEKLLRTIEVGSDLAYDVAWSMTGRQLAVAGADKAVRIVSTQADDPPTILRPHSAAVLSVLWLPDDSVLSAGVDQTIRWLRPAGGETLRSFENHMSAVRDLALRPGKQAGPPLVASAGADRTVRFWQPTIGRLVRFARLPVAPTTICWNTSGSHVLVACEDGRLRAIDPETVAVSELPGRLAGWAYSVAALPGGQWALIGGEQGQLRRIDLGALQP